MLSSELIPPYALRTEILRQILGGVCVCALELVEDAAELVDNLVLGRAAHSSDFIRFGFMSGPRSWT